MQVSITISQQQQQQQFRMDLSRNANNDTWGVMVHAWAMVMPSRSKMTVPPRIWALGSKTPSSRIMMVALKISSTEYFLGSQFPKRKSRHIVPPSWATPVFTLLFSVGELAACCGREWNRSINRIRGFGKISSFQNWQAGIEPRCKRCGPIANNAKIRIRFNTTTGVVSTLNYGTTLTEWDKLPSIKVGDFTLEVEFGPPGKELQEIAKNELRETPELQKDAIARLRELLKGKNKRKRPEFSSIQHSNVYENLKPSKEKNIFEQNILSVLPNRDQNGRRILLIELGKKWKHNKCSLDEVFKGCVLYVEAAMLEPATQIAGAIVIFDMDGLTLQQAWQFTPAFAKRIVDWLQDAVPLRIKNIHVVNQPYVFNMVFALFKPFLRDKLKNRLLIS
ncbi:Alpha-tocopherol transfer protein [Apis cerana cerana]|uniref:Alpha-tocopherol transfer protein n=1 Tax=Apis cerana cerana TaxID=94128 RepID=A0A2A3ELZ4_APICC|nr:Alpha-tocopherol transfer protein [Apis cerana cerana]